MPKIEVDLRTRMIPKDDQVFLARPGRQYRLYAAFVAEKEVGPELPGLEIISGRPIKDQLIVTAVLIASANRVEASEAWTCSYTLTADASLW